METALSVLEYTPDEPVIAPAVIAPLPTKSPELFIPLLKDESTNTPLPATNARGV